ncbi:hypothetical protein, partial [Bacillus thuringiensis]
LLRFKEYRIMKAISIILILIGIFGILMGGMMFGDIGIAAIIGSLAALFSGIGFWKLDSQLKNISK